MSRKPKIPTKEKIAAVEVYLLGELGMASHSKNLTTPVKLVKAKGDLLKAALGAEKLPVQQTEGTLRFPWFDFGRDTAYGYGNKAEACLSNIVFCGICGDFTAVLSHESDTTLADIDK